MRTQPCPTDDTPARHCVGLHVVEVKGVAFDQIEALEAGGHFRIAYESVTRSVNPFVQVRNAMFDIRDSTQRAYLEQQGLSRWGVGAFRPPELLFSDDIESLGSQPG